MSFTFFASTIEFTSCFDDGTVEEFAVKRIVQPTEVAAVKHGQIQASLERHAHGHRVDHGGGPGFKGRACTHDSGEFVQADLGERLSIIVMPRIFGEDVRDVGGDDACLLYTSPSPRDR